MRDETAARRIVVTGRVQGVGYRPFVYRKARVLALTGWVRNGGGEVQIHVEGAPGDLIRFESALTGEAPPLARAQVKTSAAAAIEGATDFQILGSQPGDDPEVHLPPDLFCCEECLEELRDARERRFRYAFTNCTQCGPRYTIIECLPYDRPNTSMSGFALCENCRREYENPLDRRFHAQPLACPECGPSLRFRSGTTNLQVEDALAAAVDALREGAIVAVKGVGGYHLMCDPANDAAMRALRARKQRPHKPLAVMFPLCGEDGLDAIRECVFLNETEERALSDPARPIVLVRRRAACHLSRHLAPLLSELGVFLPYSPLHALILDAFCGPLVATSGNISGEPVLTDNREAEVRLGTVADAFLHHNRPIVRPADDSVMRIIDGKPRAIRLGRGIAPLEIDLPERLPEPVLAVGGHMKNAIALGWERRAVIAPHIGDLDSPRSLDVFAQVISDLQKLYRLEARKIVCDAHPNYASTRWALAQNLPLMRVQHHKAHASALVGEHSGVRKWLVFTWDGIGYGSDGDLWGGEAFAGAPGNWQRVASIRSFRVTGGDKVGREPWRSAASLMWETGSPWTPRTEGANIAAAAWNKSINTAQTSSVGRLFDAAASLVLGLDVATFEGQGPMLLESISDDTADSIALPLAGDCDGTLRFDWEPLLAMLCDETRPAAQRARIFHNALADALLTQVTALADTVEFEAVGLTGGVFQNRLLVELVSARLAHLGMRTLLPQMVPANDGGLAFGQMIEALYSSEAHPS
jgi:hydrogenase maturation protein HypF